MMTGYTRSVSSTSPIAVWWVSTAQRKAATHVGHVDVHAALALPCRAGAGTTRNGLVVSKAIVLLAVDLFRARSEREAESEHRP